MSKASPRGYLALVAGTVLATLAVQRHVSHLAAAAPSRDQLPGPISRDWKAILLRTWQQIEEDRLLATAAGVVFYGLLAIFPAVTALVSSYGLFADPSTIAKNLQNLAVMLPDGAFAIVQDQIARVLAKGSSTLGVTFIFGLLMAIWSANAGMKAIFDALNVVYEEHETRSFLRLNITSLAFTIAGLASVLLMIGAVVAVPLALQRLGLGERGEWIVSLGRWPALFLFLLTALAVLYRFGPSRTNPRFQWISPGAVAATLLWLAGSALLSWYLSNFANYSATYGSLGAAIGLMTWMWMSAIIVLCGAELNSEIDVVTTGRPAGTSPAARA
jgi:membrane protein